jgi:serine/threonine protein phosphatase PrpC
VRDLNIQQLTVDHTYVQDLVERGAISSQEALSHPQSHVLTKCLGAEPRLELETQTLWVWDLEAGEVEDYLVLCSDGLYSLVSDKEIANSISNSSPQEACVHLVELAKSRGGFDNITLSILPLGGQLRDEAPPRPRKAERKKSKSKSSARSSARKIPKMSTGKKVAIGLVLMLLGTLIAAMFILLRLAG